MAAAAPEGPRDRSVLSRLSVRSSSVRTCLSLMSSSFPRMRTYHQLHFHVLVSRPVRRGFAGSRRSKSGGYRCFLILGSYGEPNTDDPIMEKQKISIKNQIREASGKGRAIG